MFEYARRRGLGSDGVQRWSEFQLPLLWVRLAVVQPRSPYVQELRVPPVVVLPVLPVQDGERELLSLGQLRGRFLGTSKSNSKPNSKSMEKFSSKSKSKSKSTYKSKSTGESKSKSKSGPRRRRQSHAASVHRSRGRHCHWRHSGCRWCCGCGRDTAEATTPGLRSRHWQ